MFGKLSTLFNNNEDQFTRTQNQFIEQWRCVEESLSTQSAIQAKDVYDTKASVHIADMIYMIEHDRIPDDSDYGPCVEFILQNEVLATLQLYAQNDVPVGMRRIVLALFSQLVQKLQRSVIPHLNVHKPLQDMICVCGGGKYPIDEINFITSILGKFHEDPSLVNLFMNETRAKNGAVNYELRLVDALISLSHSKEDRVVKKSCESLLLCVAADSEYVIDSILSYTILVQDLVSRLCQRYNSFQSDPEALLTTYISWNSQLEHVLVEGADRATLRLLLWLDYLNTLTSSSHPNFTNKFLRHLSKVFLHTHILNDFNSAQPLDAVKALTMCQKMLSLATSELLLVEVLKFLTDDPVIATLCSLLNHEDTRVLASALILLNELFETRHSLVVETLVLRYTRRNVWVRSRILLEREEGRPVLQRANSSDSGMEEMYSDEETSFIHMNTALFSHFEPDQQSPSLARKLKQLSVTSSQCDVASSQGDVTSSQGDVTSSQGDVTSSFDGVTSSLDGVTSSQNYLVSSEEHVTSSDSYKLASTESISLSELASNSSTSLNEQNDSEHSENSGRPPNNEQEQSVSENAEQKPPKKTPLSCSSITLEHNRVGSPNHFKTVIVSHDQAEDLRKSDKNGKISLKLDISVAKILDVMPLLCQPRMIGFSEYLYDAHIKEKEVQTAYSWIPPHYSTLDEEVNSEIGVFFEKVLFMVQNIPYQSYTVNMLLMSLISEIAHIPHESVTIFLLDTTLPTTPLYTALQEVAQTFTDIFEASPTLKELLLTVPDTEMPDVCRAAYLTEEFCKELAAVTLVKSTS